MTLKKIQCAALLCVTVGNAGAQTIHTFPASAYNSDATAMNQTLGIENLMVEDFEDGNLAPGLQVEMRAPDFGPASVIGTPFIWPSRWDGARCLLNRPSQSTSGSGSYADIIFRIAHGTSRFGVGLSDFQTYLNETELYVNGTCFGFVSSLQYYVNSNSPNDRNLYLIVEGDAVQPLIHTIEFRMQARLDAMCFDHLAIDRRARGSAYLNGYLASVVGDLLEIEVWQNNALVETLDGNYGPNGSFAFSPTVIGPAVLKFRFRTGLWKAVPVTLGPTPIET